MTHSHSEPQPVRYFECPTCKATPASLPATVEIVWRFSETLTLHQSTCEACGTTITLRKIEGDLVVFERAS